MCSPKICLFTFLMELQMSGHLQPVTAEMQAGNFQAPIEQADNFQAPIEDVKYTNRTILSTQYEINTFQNLLIFFKNNLKLKGSR